MKVIYRSTREQKLNVRREVVIDDFVVEVPGALALSVRPLAERGCFAVLGTAEQLQQLPAQYEEFVRGEIVPEDSQ